MAYVSAAFRGVRALRPLSITMRSVLDGLCHHGDMDALEVRARSRSRRVPFRPARCSSCAGWENRVQKDRGGWRAGSKNARVYKYFQELFIARRRRKFETTPQFKKRQKLPRAVENLARRFRKKPA